MVHHRRLLPLYYIQHDRDHIIIYNTCSAAVIVVVTCKSYCSRICQPTWLFLLIEQEKKRLRARDVEKTIS